MKLSKIIVTLSIALLVGCGGDDSEFFEGSAADKACIPSTDHLKWMGPYWGASHWYGDGIPKFSHYTNFVNVNVTGNGEQFYKEATEYRLQMLIGHTEHIFLDIGDAWSLRPQSEWQGEWEDFINELNPYIDNVLGFYIEEPFGNKVPLENQAFVASMLKQQYPDKSIFTTITRKHVSKTPEFYDVVSVTPRYGREAGLRYYEALQKLKTYLHPHQKIIITMDGYSTQKPTDSIEEDKADVAWDYYLMARCEPRAIGLYIFLWPDFEDHKGRQYGVGSMPIVEDRMIDIWERIDKGDD